MLPLLPHADRLDPLPRDLRGRGLAAYPLDGLLRQALAAAPPRRWQPTGLDREAYLALSERLVRRALPWQREDGAIVDPVENRECGQTSPRFAAPGAILLASGRCPELLEPVCLTMDYACRQLASGQAASPDFWMRELITAWNCLHDRVPAERADRWRRDLLAVEPEAVYKAVRPAGDNLHELHNWTIYAAAGEAMRQAAGLANDRFLCGDRFFDKYLPAQFCHLTAEGLYRDPGDPITYDITTRLQIGCALAHGYDGPQRADLGEILRRGGLTQLLMASPDGLVPFGGRSAEYHFREAILAALCELEARRWRTADPRLAGACKRQARLAVRAIGPWLDLEPPRSLKNGFPPDARHGYDAYGVYSVYSLLCASFLGLAALFADDTIAEAPCPAETGGFVLPLMPAFHKVFATAGDTQLVIDTAADPHHDATGIGRFSRAGVPIALGPGMPCAATPSFRLADLPLTPRAAAIAPAWPGPDGAWIRLAEQGASLTTSVDTRVATPARCDFTLTQCVADAAILTDCTLTPGCLALACRVRCAGQPVPAIRLEVPILVTDGDADAACELAPGCLAVSFRGHRLRLAWPPVVTMALSPPDLANRHGVYRLLTLEAPGESIAVTLELGCLV